VDAADSVKRLGETAAALGEKLGPVLFQLPPFQRKDLARLEAFLATLAEAFPTARAAFEFRHASWFEDDVFAALRARDAALCIADADDFTTPPVATASWGYLRLRRADYDEAALRTWAERVKEQNWSECSVYFKHEDEARGPALAGQFVGLLPPAA
jgi:uncharacterized protein YecE (DUF72 family)